MTPQNNTGKSGLVSIRLGAPAIAQSLLTLAFLGAPIAVTAAEGTSLEDLDQRIRILERQLEIQKEEADTRAKDATTSKIDDKGVSIRKGDFELKIKGLVQADVRTYVDDYNPANTTETATTNRNGLYSNDTVTFRRIRPAFEGSFGRLLGFRLTPEFAGNGSVDAASIVDAYIDLKFDPAATLRVGKVKGPVALERLQSGGSISFVERGFPTELAPNRDIGIQLQGELFSSTLNYTLGYYNGTADGRDVSSNDVDNRKELGARLFVEPFKNEPGFFQGLGFGVGSSFGTKDQGAFNAGGANHFLPRIRTPGQLQVFSYNTAAVAATGSAAGTTGVFADGDHTRISPQLYFYRNSFGLLSEHIASKQELSQGFVPIGGGSTPTAFTKQKLNNEAWQVVVSYVLTGEDASFRGVTKPSSPFTLGGPGWGAFEVAARFGKLEIDKDAFDAVDDGGVSFARFADPATQVSEAESWTLGLNWYLTSNLKAVLNYSQVKFEGGGGGTAAAPEDREEEKTVFGRIQLAF